ncbi:Rv2578c family radical SAM protein [Modestobacter excelsi]|uniref:Rv2578c family radical SAM protein n=1 Tax=Modestobacter excelsi TaxID=2213161 RepID=UPI00110CFFD3|nr:Rv2578c family radical SAM protein [Modestobacter excelsi]
MRWDAQRLDLAEPETLPGLPTVRGLLRSVEVPEFPGLTFHEVRAKSALNAVPKGSAMPFGHTINTFRGCSHACVYCVSGDTAVLLADGRQRAIADLRVGDRIVGTEQRGSYRHYVGTEVLAHWSTVKPAHRVRLADGTTIVASGDHRFLTGRGWKHVTGIREGRPYLSVGDELAGSGASLTDTSGGSRGGDARERGPVAVLERRPVPVGALVRGGPELSVTAVDDLAAEMPMFDITTGTGDFIANGVVSHNCFARGTHEWLELDSGQDFDQQIVVKTNVVEVLRRELARPSWNREHVALGTNTDPYQRAEGRYRLMPGVIDALARSGTPFSVLSKGTLARRDLPLLAAASRDVPIGMGVSMAIWDDDLHAALEPGAPTPRARLDLVRAITDAGLPCGVFLAPVLPGLTDGRQHLAAAIGAIAEAGATGVTVLPLHLRPGAREWFTSWLAREHPGLVGRYRQLYGRGAYVPAEYRSWLAGRVAPLLAAHGLDRHSGGTTRGLSGPTGAPAGSDTGLPGDETAGFPVGSLPVRLTDPVAPAPEQAEQLSLC